MKDEGIKMETIEVATVEGIQGVEATSVVIFKYIKTYIHPRLLPDNILSNSQYSITEQMTGMSIGWGVGKEDAVSNARKRLRKYGKKRVLEVLGRSQKLLRFVEPR